MTVQNSTYRADYIGNGVTTSFPIPFAFLDSSHVGVYLAGVLLTLNSNYTIAGAGVGTGGTLTMFTAPGSGVALAIVRNAPYTQLTHFVPNDPLPAASLENALDLNTMQNQQIQEQLNRAPVLPANIPSPGAVPTPVSGSVLGWTGTAWAWLSGASVTLAANLLTAAAGYGTSLVNYLAPFTGAVARLLNAKLAETVSVTDFGADRTGVSDSSAAFLAAAAALPASGGILRVPAGTYYSASGITITRNNLTIIGEGMPRVATNLHSLTGGTIIQNQFQIVGDNITVQSLGVDSGNDFSVAHLGGAGANGLVIHDPANIAIHYNVNVRDCIGLCRIPAFTSDPAAAFHAILLEGLQYGSGDNLVGIGGWFGVVLKVSDFNCGFLRAMENDSASVILKSQSYAPVTRVNIDNVSVYNSVARGYYGMQVVASSGAVSNVTVGNVSVQGGGSAVSVRTESTYPVDTVAIGTVTARNCGNGISVQGSIYNLTVGTASVWQPTGLGLTTGVGGLGTDNPLTIAINTLRVVPSGSYAYAVDIASPTTVATLGLVDVTDSTGAIGAYSNINIQNNTNIGQCIGTIKYAGTVPALINGWASAFGQATGVVVQNGWTCGFGRIIATSATNDTFMTTPAGFAPASLQFFATMTGYNGSTNQLVPVTVQISSGSIALYPNRAAYSSLSWFNLTDLKFPTKIPTTGGI